MKTTLTIVIALIYFINATNNIMIVKKVRSKNFFSVGNDFLEIDLLKHKQSVLHGANGDGKSTTLSAITFGLFGKTIKNVTKGQIVNSLNNKNCIVEIELSNNDKEYLIRRGIKPNIFEVFEDGNLIDQTAVLDYQNFLEETILKVNYRTFLQTSIISIEAYTPFMSLPKGQRREFIEDILDVKVFSVMNTLVKSKINRNKEELKLTEVKIKSLKDRIVLQKSHIEKLEEMKTIGIESFNKKIKEYENEIKDVSNIFDTSDDVISGINEKLTELKEISSKKISIMSMISDINTQVRLSEKDILFFESNNNCPSCRQVISKDHVYDIVDSQKSTNKTLKTTVDEYTQELTKYSTCDRDITLLQNKLSAHNSSISSANDTIRRLNKMIVDVTKEKANLNIVDDVLEQRLSMKATAIEALQLRERQTEVSEEQDYNTIMLELLKDSGIKSKIIDQYLPVINKLVNQYLERLDFFVSFNLDSEFNETIKSRHRDDFSYGSFSAGEKQRIDLALLFTFHHLATMRNSFSCNLLCLDEITDSSLDSAGVLLLTNILKSEEFDNTNLYIISHGNKEQFEEVFPGSYFFYKRDGFTQVNVM